MIQLLQQLSDVSIDKRERERQRSGAMVQNRGRLQGSQISEKERDRD